MAEYSFSQCLRATGDLHIPEVLDFLKLMQQAFCVPGWIDENEQPVSLSLEGVMRMLTSNFSSSEIKRSGALQVLKPIGTLPNVLVVIRTGGDEWTSNHFNIDFPATIRVPHLQYFRRSVELIQCSEACISESVNTLELIEKLQQKPWPWMPEDGRPIALHWFHFLDGEMVEKLGGVEHCLQAPVYKAESFCGGILFQLTSLPFDNDDPVHREIQQMAMQHLNLG